MGITTLINKTMIHHVGHINISLSKKDDSDKGPAKLLRTTPGPASANKHGDLSIADIPVWMLAAAGLLIVLILGICCYCICCRCGNKKKKKDDNKEKKEKVDLKRIQMLNASYQEKVQPSVDELDYNSEDYMSEESAGAKIGRIHFTLDYDFNENALTVGIIEAKDVPAKDLSGMSDPYVRVVLLPDKKKRFETKVHKKNLNPFFNEKFVFKNISYSEITNRTLCMELYDFDRFSGHDMIGEARLQMIDVDLASEIDDWRALTPPSSSGGLLMSITEDIRKHFHPTRSRLEKSKSECGDICFSLRYVPASGKLTITILEGKNLKSMDISGYSDPYVKLALVQEGRKIKKKKTTVKKRTLNPYYNESFTFQVPFDKIDISSIIVSVLDYDRVGRSEVIGKCVVGELSSGADQKHWTDMIASPRRPIAQWHSLHD